MNLELFIAKRIYFSRQKGEKRVSSPAIKIAIAGVAIGLAAMTLALSIVIGFKKEVRNKVIGFGSHIQISSLSDNGTLDYGAICVTPGIIDTIQQFPGVKHTELYANMSGIIKTDNDFQGVMFKGVGADYDWDFFRKNMVEGDILAPNDTTGNKAIISKYIADKLELSLGDTFISYFIQESSARPRKFTISGIYSTNFEEYDKLYLITDISIIQRLQGWEKDKVSGIEILVEDYDELDSIRDELFFEMLGHRDREGNAFYTRSIKEMNPNIFGWLDLLDMNVVVIILLMLAISGFTMTSGLLIIILENTNLIGTLKTMGMRNGSIRKTFLYVASFLVIKGMIWGNIIAVAIIVIQKYTGILKLDPNNYYVTQVPVETNILYWILLNIGTLVVTVATMIIPSYLISKISPAKSIRYE
ncbi:ABC transporter permease [Dysgonomonas sp. 25]|uniref:ABC transporter permease n=1 Tax=Dysgonomonas sp. 25 TaxID=2302933 RepID=UPI0013D3BE9E|nr:ABC transporter permease [Dysgonomonas sp. 25]NDV67401.1 ABC transporter permease [Dysgonomonas sp. 25]